MHIYEQECPTCKAAWGAARDVWQCRRLLSVVSGTTVEEQHGRVVRRKSEAGLSARLQPLTSAAFQSKQNKDICSENFIKALAEAARMLSIPFSCPCMGCRTALVFNCKCPSFLMLWIV